MLTFTVPESLRGLFLRSDRILYKALFAATSGAVKDLFVDPKHLIPPARGPPLSSALLPEE
ncbi:MAG: hypothetical protein GVY36_08715 [Verrucomicrobia bacterium]|jgi:hypothetical protein|nr:hypothetical protein [Verrucomicrobiota bacterium]